MPFIVLVLTYQKEEPDVFLIPSERINRDQLAFACEVPPEDREWVTNKHLLGDETVQWDGISNTYLDFTCRQAIRKHSGYGELSLVVGCNYQIEGVFLATGTS